MAPTVPTMTRRRRVGPAAGARNGERALLRQLRHRRRLLVFLAVGQAEGDLGPQPFGRRLHRVAHGGRDLAQAVELGATTRAGLEMLLELGELVAVDGIERVGTQQIAGFFVRHHASTPRTPASARTARMRRMPLRIRLLTVPSGWSSISATSR